MTSTVVVASLNISGVVTGHMVDIFSRVFGGSLKLKGIVSRDWGSLQMGSLDRSEFCTIPLEVYF
jgi:hypothetical protein